MKIRIDQTLHGYSNGHQLLASSISLPNDVRERLLIHTDLSGSNIDNGFKEYISGYPLQNNLYALGRTWYADEMKRPGCVWTHTLLIQIADLGKIPDFKVLNKLFFRPYTSAFLRYEDPIHIEKTELIDINRITMSDEGTAMRQAMYESPTHTILVSRETSANVDDLILELWSDQWPRLRRNFTFCTGALSLKVIEGREFDLQVIPSRNANAIVKRSVKPLLLEDFHVERQPWVNILYNSPKNQLRRFLWVYGSDVPGHRKYYVPLITLFGELNIKPTNFTELFRAIETYFPQPEEGLLLKSKIIAPENPFRIDGKELITYLMSEDNFFLNDVSISQIEKRIVEEFNNSNLSLDELVILYNSASGKLNSDLWHLLDLDEGQILYLLRNDVSVPPLFTRKVAHMAERVDTWKISLDVQEKLISFLLHAKVNWKNIIFSILDASSDVIRNIIKSSDGIKRGFILDWQNSRNRNLPNSVEKYFWTHYRYDITQYISENAPEVSPILIANAIRFLNNTDIQNLNIDGLTWISLYGKIDDKNAKSYAACLLLALSLNNKIRNAPPLISHLFLSVFELAKLSMIDHGTWRHMPVDLSQEDDLDNSPLQLFISLVTFTSRVVKNVPSWDYCELLIRTLANKFIKHGWHLRFYVDSLNSQETFGRSIHYCISFKKGNRLLDNIITGIKQGEIKLSNDQHRDLEKILSL